MPESNSPAKILVVDDNESTRYLLSRALRQAGYQIVEAATGEEALALVKERPDLVTLDVHLPDINGMEICKRIKADPDTRAIPVVHISATFVQSRDKALALDSGADGYLTHPLEDIVLVATVGAFLRARQAEKRSEELLLQSKRDLEEIKLERDLRESFVATLSHDLRTPMTAAKISAQLVLRQPDLSDAAQKLVNRIGTGIDRMDQMIRDLLDANLIRAGGRLPIVPAACDLQEVVGNTLEELATMHGDRFQLRCEGPALGMWDAQALRRVVENLASNAIKYGSAYGRVLVTIEDRGEEVSLSVHNEGNPLSPEDQTNLFEPYIRAASARASGQKGWGLGLTLVRGVAQAHGGSVRVSSSPAAGTTFTVTFPAKPVLGEATSLTRVKPAVSTAARRSSFAG